MYQFLQYHVADVMVRQPFTLSPQASVAELGQLFSSHNFNGVPVVQDGELCGFVTKLDFLRAFRFSPESLLPHYDSIMARPIASIMSSEPFCVTEDMPLTRVLECMVEMRSKSFPVVRGKQLVGIIAREDLLAALRQAVEGA